MPIYSVVYIDFLDIKFMELEVQIVPGKNLYKILFNSCYYEKNRIALKLR